MANETKMDYVILDAKLRGIATYEYGQQAEEIHRQLDQMRKLVPVDMNRVKELQSQLNAIANQKHSWARSAGIDPKTVGRIVILIEPV